MTRTILHCAQRSPEWRQARVGRLTASRADDATAAPLKSGGTPARTRDYIMQLVAERLTGQPQDTEFINEAMQWGIDHEAAALTAYEGLTGRIVMPVGFVQADDLLVGCSPDGLVGDEGTLSIKCPKTATHLGYLRAGVVPADYLPQMWAELWITGGRWVDFFSFDPRLPERLQTFLIRYTRDEAEIDRFATKALAFLGDVAREESSLRGWRAEMEMAR